MSVETTKLQEGDTLVNDDGSVTIGIEAVDGDTIVVNDSRRYTDDGEYPRDEIESALNNGFTLVRDSELTVIKGVGDATAPKLEAMTGCTTPDELAERFLCGTYPVHEAVPRTDYFNQWVSENIEDLNVDATKAQTRVMLFLIEHNCRLKVSSLVDTHEFGNHKYDSVDGEKLTVNHLKWEDGSFWIDSAAVAGVGFGDWLQSFNDAINPDEYVTCDSYETYNGKGEHYQFHANGNTTYVSSDYVRSFTELFAFDLSDVRVHRDGEYPVLIDDEDTELQMSIAPRIPPQ